MTPGFQHFLDPFGNLMVADGMVAQLKTGVYIPVGAGGPFDPNALSGFNTVMRCVRQSGGGTFIGGSGLNLVASGLPGPTLSGPEMPVGLFQRVDPSTWVMGIFTLSMDSGTGHTVLSDGTDVVAEYADFFTGSVALASTAYGQTTYGSGSPFTLDFDAEFAAPGTYPDVNVSVTSGTAQTGVFSSTDGLVWTSVDDPDWTVTINADGSADFAYSTTVVAARSSGSTGDPGGRFDSAGTAIDDYNSGEDFSVWVAMIPQLPVPGFSYLKITESAGVISTVDGPFFAATLPTSAGDVYYVPLVQCDGTAIEQFHTGLLLWPDASGGGGTTIQDITQAAYDALSPPDPGTVYNITDADWAP